MTAFPAGATRRAVVQVARPGSRAGQRGSYGGRAARLFSCTTPTVFGVDGRKEVGQPVGWAADYTRALGRFVVRGLRVFRRGGELASRHLAGRNFKLSHYLTCAALDILPRPVIAVIAKLAEPAAEQAPRRIPSREPEHGWADTEAGAILRGIPR